MRINVERSRMMGASWGWIYFVLTSPDVMTRLNRAPLVVSRVDARKFSGHIFGVNVDMRVVVDSHPDPEDEVVIVADVRMPAQLGRTHTTADYKYCAVKPMTTLVELRLDLETVGPAMAVYAAIKNARIQSYLATVMSDNERAAVLLETGDAAITELLSDEQLERVEAWRQLLATLDSVMPEGPGSEPSTHGVEETRLWHSELGELTALYAKVQGRAQELEDELLRIRETRDGVATLLVARRMLEVIVQELCVDILGRARGTEPLARVLEKLGKSDDIPDYVVTSMQNLNRLSTYGAHPKEFKPRQVREALIALCSIMEWHVSRPASQ